MSCDPHDPPGTCWKCRALKAEERLKHVEVFIRSARLALQEGYGASDGSLTLEAGNVRILKAEIALVIADVTGDT